MIRKLSSLCFVLLLHSFGIFGQDITQNSTINNALAAMFSEIAVDSVHTGYLLDRAVEATNIRVYNGTITNNNVVDAAAFRNCLITINSSIINSNAVGIDGNAVTNSLVEPGKVNIGIALYKYNYIVPNALSSNLIRYQNDKVYNVSIGDVVQNPYGEDYMFVFTPSATGKTGTTVNFKFTASHFFGNVSPASIEFDAGKYGYDDYHTIVFPCDTTIAYADAGVKELKMRVTLDDNTVLVSHSTIEVFPQPAATMTNTMPTDTHWVRCTASDGRRISALVSGMLRTSGHVQKPLIYVEGFDDRILGVVNLLASYLDSTGRKKAVSDLISLGVYDNTHNKLRGLSYGDYDFHWLYDNNVLSTSIKSNYDIFYVDWNNPEASIIDNAQLLVLALDWINGLKSSSSERNIIIGHSMGGLIARYALRDIETTPNATHETDVFVSFDSPQMGVNVPLGLQYALRDLEYVFNRNSGVSDYISFDLFNPVFSYIMSIYNCPSAKQMMYYYVEPNGSLNTDYHTNWQNILNSIGYPQGDLGHPIYNLAIVNGGAQGSTSDPLFSLDVSIGNNPFWSPGWPQILLTVITDSNNLELSFVVNRNLGNGATIATSHASFKKPFAWLTGKSFSLLGTNGRTHTSPVVYYRLDDLKSSYLDTSDALSIDSGNDNISYSLKNILFVPETSALGISLENSLVDYFNVLPANNNDSPFDTYYLNSSYQHHAHVELAYFSWIDDQARLSISGPDDFALDGDFFSTNCSSQYSHPSWAISDDTIASISNSGELTVGNNKSGIVTLTYQNNNGNGAYLLKRKTFLAGFPMMNLNKSRQDSTYTITAHCISSQSGLETKLDELASSGKIRFIWGIKTSGDINWADTTSSRSFVYTAPANTEVTVFMKMLSTQHGVVSETSNTKMFRSTTIRFYFDPGEILADSVGYRFVYNFVTGLYTLKYLAVFCNPDYNGTAIIPDSVQIDSYSYPVVDTISCDIDGQLTTVYCFNIKNCPVVQQVISDVRQGNNEPGLNQLHTIPLEIKNGATVLQQGYLVVSEGDLSNPRPPIIE